MGRSLVSCKDVELQMSFFIFRQLQEKYLAKRKDLHWKTWKLLREYFVKLYGR